MKGKESLWSKKSNLLRQNIDLIGITSENWSEYFLNNNSFTSEKAISAWHKLEFLTSMGVKCDELYNRIFRKETKIEGLLLTHNTDYMGISLSLNAYNNFRTTFYDIENGPAKHVSNTKMHKDKGEMIINTNRLIDKLVSMGESANFKQYLTKIGDNYKQLGLINKAYLEILIYRYGICPEVKERDLRCLNERILV